MSEIRVSATEPEPTHHLSLSDGTNTLGVYLCDGGGQKNPRAIRRTLAQRTPLKTQSGATKYADYELPFNSVAQDDWSAGRGWEDFERNTSRYFDGKRINAEHAGQLILGGQENYCTGYRTQVMAMPGSITWQALYGADRFRARSFVAPAGGIAVRGAEIWLRRVGTPGTLSFTIRQDDAGSPGTVVASTTVNTAIITDTLSVLHKFSVICTLSAGATYHVVIGGAATDSVTNHWEIGCDAEITGDRSTDGTTWSAAMIAPYYRVTDAELPFIALFFEYKGQLYFATRPDDGSAGKIYMNGYRGLADLNSLDLTYLYDSTQTGWSDTLAGAVAQIYDGAGVQEAQNWRTITGGQSGAVAVSPDWNIFHAYNGADATQYNILGTNGFSLVHTGAYPFHDVAVTGEMAWLCSGEARSAYRPIYKMRHYSNGEGWVNYWGSESETQASFLKAIPHPTLGYTLWLACNNDATESVTLTRAPAPRDQTADLMVARGYHSAAPAGFMKERFISPLVSDNMNRANGALGNTNGGGHAVAYPFSAGGSGVSWVEFTGTWAIASNVAKSSALAGGKALAGFSPASNNIVVQAEVTHASGYAGVFVRRADDNNYIFAATNGTKLRFVKRVAGVETILFDNDITYATGAVLEVKCNLTTFEVRYNNVQIDTDQVIGEAGLQSGAGVGLYTTHIDNTFDDVVVYENPVVITTTGTNSATIDVPASFTTGIIASDVVNVEDWRRYSKLLMSIKSSKAIAANELQLVIDNNALCSSPIKTVDLGALSAGIRYGFKGNSVRTIDVEFDLSATTGANEVRSVGLNLTVDPSSDFTINLTFYWLEPDVEMIPIGDSCDLITGLERYGDPETLWVLKQGSIWEVNNDIPTAIPLREMAAVKSSTNGAAHLVHDVYLYFSLLHSLERYFRQNMDDIGPNRDAGLPYDRQGVVSCMAGYPGKIFIAIDGGTDNYSSVLVYTGSALHEIYRAPRVGARIRRLHIQPIPGDQPSRLWISQGADVLWIPIPSVTFNPYYDRSYRFTHEASLTTSWFYCGLRDVIKKFKSVKLFSEGLSNGATVDLYYRTDDSATWTKVASSFNTSPVQEIDLSATNSVTGKRIQFRLVLNTDDNTATPKIVAIVLENLERLPIKWQYAFTFNMSDGLLELGERDPDDTTIRVENIVNQLNTWLSGVNTLTLRSVFSPYDNKTVMLDSYGTEPIRVIYDEQQEQHLAQATVIEI